MEDVISTANIQNNTDIQRETFLARKVFYLHFVLHIIEKSIEIEKKSFDFQFEADL